MQHSHGKKVLSRFMENLATAPSSILLLDYDGILAPFHVERHLAYPYPGVVPALKSILGTVSARVAIVTGRPAVEIGPLLGPLDRIEIWGSHGLEHLMADGTCRKFPIDPKVSALLSRAGTLLTKAGLTRTVETKPGGIAVHWRGLLADECVAVRMHAQSVFAPFADQPGLKQLAFEEGIELRVEHPNKGDVVRSVLDASDDTKQVAFLGDDLTDEDAFRALNRRGLSVLVRPKYRETQADIWIEPLDGLLDFLRQWRDAVSRPYKLA